MEEVHEFQYLDLIMCKHGRRDKRKSCARKESGWISWAYDERKDSKHGGKKGTA